MNEVNQKFRQKIIKILNENNISKENQEYIISFWNFLIILDPNISLPEIRYDNLKLESDIDGFVFYWNTHHSISLWIKITQNNELEWEGFDRNFYLRVGHKDDSSSMLDWIEKVR